MNNNEYIQIIVESVFSSMASDFKHVLNVQKFDVWRRWTKKKV